MYVRPQNHHNFSAKLKLSSCFGDINFYHRHNVTQWKSWFFNWKPKSLSKFYLAYQCLNVVLLRKLPWSKKNMKIWLMWTKCRKKEFVTVWLMAQENECQSRIILSITSVFSINLFIFLWLSELYIHVGERNIIFH